MRFAWGFLLGLLVGGVLALALFARPLCQHTISTQARGLLGSVFGSDSKVGGVLGDLVDNLINSKV